MGNCKTKGCTHYAITNNECRYCKGRRDYESIVTLRTVLNFFGAKIKLLTGFFGPTIKKKVAKAKPISVQTIKEIPVVRVRKGMVLAADHGKVISRAPHQSRKKGSSKGILFTTTKRNVWFPLDSRVWIVTGTKMVKV